MKYICAFCICLVLSLGLFAQKDVDVIYLKDSSIYRGTILNSTAEAIKIESLCKNTLVFPANKVLKVTNEEFINERSIKNRGYLNLISAGALFGSTANEIRAPLSLLMENNYRLNKYFAAGAVVGLELLNEATVPVGLNLKGLLPLKGGSTAFIGGSAGYSFSVEKAKDPIYEITESHGGVMANAEVGLMFPSYGNLSFFIAAGYRYNELSYTREDWQWEEVDRKIFYNRISIRVGIMFY